MPEKKKNKGGRPTKYKEEYCDLVDTYLEENQDEYDDWLEKEKYSDDKPIKLERRLVVKLPTVSGFAIYVGVDETTLHEWKRKHPKFRQSLEKIKAEQKKRLLNSGLSGEYNSTIAKLILSANHGMAEKKEEKITGSLEINQKKKEILDKIFDDKEE